MSEMRSRVWPVWLLSLVVVVGACAEGAGNKPSPTAPEPTTTRLADRTSTTSPALPSGMDVVVGTDADGFAKVATALADAVEKWEANGPATYGYRVSTSCSDCGDQDDTFWVRRFEPDWPDDLAGDVGELHQRVSDALAESPERVEVAFHPEVGIPVWFEVEDDGSESFAVEEYHEISRTPTPFDGEWRFVGGELDGRTFENPTTGLIVATLGDGWMSFPIDCNGGAAPVDIHESFFGVGSIAQTEMGCGQYSEEAELFTRALQASTTIERQDDGLVLSGEDSLLRFVPIEQPESRGELPLTAAGETLLIEPDAGPLASVLIISSGRDEHPGHRAIYMLDAVVPGSSREPSWRPWHGEVEVPEPPSGPVEVVIPDGIGVGDYRLCSPYWSGDFFCYDLLVRLPSAPWYVTAGADGVVLHDADGTSETVWEEAARIAFWFEDLMVVEPESGPVLTVADSGGTSELAPAGSRLLDAAGVGDSVEALLVRNGRTALVGISSGGESVLGDEVLEGRLGGEAAILRTSPTRVEARSVSDGSTLWEMAVDEHEMISSVSPTEMRLDSGRLNTDGSAPSFWQYLDTRIVDVATGDVIEEFTTELAIPLEGDEVTEPCLRAELRDGLMLCPQADGRFMTIGVEGGDQSTVTGVRDVIATYVRSGPVP